MYVCVRMCVCAYVHSCRHSDRHAYDHVVRSCARTCIQQLEGRPLHASLISAWQVGCGHVSRHACRHEYRYGCGCGHMNGSIDSNKTCHRAHVHSRWVIIMNLCIDMRSDMSVDMCEGTRTGVCAGLCADLWPM